MKERKIVCIGDSAVGKTTLLKGFFESKKLEPYKPTIAVERTTLEINSLGIRFQVWDFSGQRYLRDFQVEHFRGADGAIVMFDLSRRDTFYSLRDWLKHTWKVVGIIPTLLVGNKGDLRETALAEIMVSHEEAEKFADYLSKQTGREIPYIEISAVLKANVNQIFTELGRLLYSGEMVIVGSSMDALDKSVKAAVDEEIAREEKITNETIQQLVNKVKNQLQDLPFDERLADFAKKILVKGFDEALVEKLLMIIAKSKDSIDRFFSFTDQLQNDVLTVLKRDPTWQQEKMFHYLLNYKAIEAKIKKDDLVPEQEVSHFTTLITNSLMIYPEALSTLEKFKSNQWNKLIAMIREYPQIIPKLYLEIYKMKSR
ncbi:MAG: GTP-binding protein [Candidatus Hodarchaeales archaeon]